MGDDYMKKAGEREAAYTQKLLTADEALRKKIAGLVAARSPTVGSLFLSLLLLAHPWDRSPNPCQRSRRSPLGVYTAPGMRLPLGVVEPEPHEQCMEMPDFQWWNRSDNSCRAVWVCCPKEWTPECCEATAHGEKCAPVVA